MHQQPQKIEITTSIFDKNSQPELIVDNVEKINQRKQHVAKQIDAANYPIIIIGDPVNATQLGAKVDRLYKAFNNCAFVFENDHTAQAFYYGCEVANTKDSEIDFKFELRRKQIGVLDLEDKDEEARHDPAFTRSDCILVLGDIGKQYKAELMKMKENGQTVIFANDPSTHVDIDMVADMRRKDRDSNAFVRRYSIFGVNSLVY